MKKTIAFVCLLWVSTCFSSLSAQDFPAVPQRLVSDYTETLSSSELQRLEQKLVAFDDSTSTQIAVVIMKTTGQYDIADYGVRLAQKWGIGGKENNNGVLLLVALGDRAVTIQTGYGVEGAVPDAIAYRIIENEIKPPFRQGDYFTGLDRATDALISYTKGEYNTPRKSSEDRTNGVSLLLIIVVIVVVLVASRKGGGRDDDGEMFGRRGASDIFWWTMMNEMGRKNSGGGMFGGGSGGGFGGFGGGGFGGGGASGRW